MATGFSAYLANALMNAVGNATAFSVTTPFVKLHTAEPGVAGTTSPATETTRKSVSYGASSGGIILNDAAITWTNIAGSQDATHFSCWDDVSAGNFLFSGTITANAYVAGDTYTVAIGGLSTSLTLAT